MHLPRGNPQTARLHREWLSKLPELTGKPLTRIAKEVKLAASTLTRPLTEGEDGTSTLHADTIGKVTSFYGVAPPANVAGTPPLGRRAAGFGEEASPYEPEGHDPLQSAIAALVGERSGITAWTLRTRAVELAGFLPGDVLLLDLNASPQPGDLVCAQVYEWSSMKAETVVRIFEKAGPLQLLLPKSADPALSAPLLIDSERVAIKGVFLPHRLRHPTA